LKEASKSVGYKDYSNHLEEHRENTLMLHNHGFLPFTGAGIHGAALLNNSQAVDIGLSCLFNWSAVTASNFCTIWGKKGWF